MVDALAAEHVEAGGDVLRWGVLAGVAGEAQAASGCHAVGVDEFLGGIGSLGPIHPQPDQLRSAAGEHVLDHLAGHGRLVLAVDVGDQTAPHPEVGLRFADAIDQTVDAGWD